MEADKPLVTLRSRDGIAIGDDITGPEQIAPTVRGLAKPGDFVVFLGAGNITQWAYALPKEMADGVGA